MSTELVSQAPEMILQKGIEFFDNHEWARALDCFEELAPTRSGDAGVHNYKARTFERLGRYEDALTCLDQALAIDPGNCKDLRNRAIALRKLGRALEALAGYEAVLERSPGDIDALVRRALLLNELDRREEALACAERALTGAPDDPDVINTRVIILENLGRYGEALADIDRMLAIQPHHVDAINNTGMILARLGRFRESLLCYNRSLSLKPDQPQARFNRSLIRLALGDWILGFQEFETRWNTPPLNGARLPGVGQLWSGQEDLYCKTLLVYHEQGYGDSLQCVRYIPLLAERGARVILAVPPALQTLMQTLPGVSAVISGGDALPTHDFQCPLMSLPLAFRTTPDTVPAPVPYLRADPELAAEWRRRLGEHKRFRIGIAWGGRRYAPINYPRDVPLEALRPLLTLEADFISLQKEIAETDRGVLADLPQLRPLGESLGDFADTAALIKNLDLVIAADSAVVHLAGALGKPVWLMNRYASCWRWLQLGDRSTWYPTLRQFRQSNVGDWGYVVRAVRDAAITLMRSSPSEDATPVVTPSDIRESADGRRRSGFGAEAVAISRSATRPSLRTARDKIRFVCATRLSSQDFFSKTPLGRSLPVYRSFPKRQCIELRLFPNNKQGLSSVYNTAIDEAQSTPAILVFAHDDIFLSDYYWAEHLHQALDSFDIVGLAGNRRRVPRQASWMYLDSQFTCDNYDNLSGVLGHGDAFPDLKQLSVYGEPGQEVKLLDGVMMAVRSQTLRDSALRFDPQFTFHFYDLDFCRQAELRHLRMGTCAMSIVHASAGRLGCDGWHAAYRDYLQKYGEWD